jgi:4-hydroxybenzoate polyprenyltransferase
MIREAAVRAYLNFVKIEHTLFSLPVIYSGVALGSPDSFPPLRVLLLILVAATGARTAAFALNRIIDRRIDARNPRTRGRELPSGTLTTAQAWGVFAAGTVVYLAAAWGIAPICLALSPAPLIVFVVYPYMKRFTPLAHFGVGLALALGPAAGWFAVTLAFRQMQPILLLFLFTFFWVAGFDTIYATQDTASDRREGLHSIPAALGDRRAIQVSGLLHLAAFGCLAALTWTELNRLAALPFLVMAGLLLYFEHRMARNVAVAFFRINAVLGFVVLALVLAGVLT